MGEEKVITEAEEINMEPSARRMTRLERLKNEAMDFTFRNTLLVRPEQEEALRFPLDSGFFFEGGYTDITLFMALAKNVPEEKLEELLGELENADRQMRKTCGRRILYLAVDYLRWRFLNQEDPQVMQRTPLFLCPARIYRNVQGRWVFQAERENTFFNPVLREYLFQNYQIDLFSVKENPGEDYNAELEQIRRTIAFHEDWRIISDKAELSLFRVPDEAIWRGLSDENLQNHEVVKGILEGAMTWDNELTLEDFGNDDEYRIFAFEADSSQSRIIRSVSRKRAQIVTGPAGNGKSQTIANIIVEQMRQGKRVLFVAEKLSAIEVIESKLREVGLQDFCLTIPDRKAALSGLKERIPAMLKKLGADTPKEAAHTDNQKKFRETLKKLCGYAALMRERHSCGQTLEELLNEYESLRNFPDFLDGTLVGEAMNGRDAAEILMAFGDAAKNCPMEAVSCLPYLLLEETDGYEEIQRKELVNQAINKFEVLVDKIWNFESLLGINLSEETKKNEFRLVMTYAKALLECPVLGEYLQVPKEKKEDSANLDVLIEKLLRTPSGSSIGRKAEAEIFEQLDALRNKREGTRDHLAEGFGFMEGRTSVYYGGNLTMSQMRQMEKNARFESYYMQLEKLLEGRPAIEQAAVKKFVVMLGRGQGSAWTDAARRLLSDYKCFSEAQGAAVKAVLRNVEEFEKKYPDRMKMELIQSWKELESDDSRIRDFVAAYRRAADAGLENLAVQAAAGIYAGQMNPDDIPKAFAKCRCGWNIAEIYRKMTEEQKNILLDYAHYLNRFQKYEKAAREEIREGLFGEVMSYMPDIREGISNSTEPGVLQRLIRKSGSQLTVRQFFEGAPKLLGRLFPCILMSPGAVASNISVGTEMFDLVIFDEASQLPAYKALIPVSCGFQTLFFGDEKQLAPTAFFRKKRINKEEITVSEESALEAAVVTSMPTQRLLYHYRSRYEGLVAFSNNRYYDGDLITFPDLEKGVTGIHWIPVSDGCYDRGGDRNNDREAERVLELVQEIYKNLPEDTEENLGIITFNLEQMKLIQAKLKKAVSDGIISERLSEKLIDVVNLEACQGQEWERTILSMTYGPDKDGELSANFGPLSRDDGGNRLNVMLTRSRRELYAVSSMTPEMLGENLTGGNRDFRDFMIYARDGKLPGTESDAANVDGQSSVVAEAVARCLRKKGFAADTCVGCSSFKVDVAVAVPGEDKYRLGILLDDTRGGSSAIYDREILIPAVLERKGWKIYRLQGWNWYRDADYEMEKIEKLLR